MKTRKDPHLLAKRRRQEIEARRRERANRKADKALRSIGGKRR